MDLPVEHLPEDHCRIPSALGELDLHLIGEGRHEQLWKVLGAHPRVRPGDPEPVRGTSFALWAPGAREVRLVAEEIPGGPEAVRDMCSLGESGIWETFVPGVGDGCRYRYDLLGADGTWRSKADPFAFAAGHPEDAASLVYTSRHTWGDARWMRRRARREPHAGPLSIYEVHLGSWRPGLSYRELAEQLPPYVAGLGFTHVVFLPLAEHPAEETLGYQASAYYAPTSRFGTPDDLRHLVDRLHQAGIGVILDWVPSQAAPATWALSEFDGTRLYEHPGSECRARLALGQGRPEVRNFLVANALYWCEEFHVDGLRMGALASMLYPPESRGGEDRDAVAFLQETNATVYRLAPGVMTLAEDSGSREGVTRWTEYGGLGFGFETNTGWSQDSLGYMTRDPAHRKYHHGEITFPLAYAYAENYVLAIGSDEPQARRRPMLPAMPGTRAQRFANVRAYLGFMWAHPGKKLLSMGQELAQEEEWAPGRGLHWDVLEDPCHQGVQELVGDLNEAYTTTPALWRRDVSPDGFTWIEPDAAEESVLAFLRLDGWGDCLVCVSNFSAVTHSGFRIGLPRAGVWRQVLNTDAASYGGSAPPGGLRVVARERPWRACAASTELVLPPLTTLWLKPEPELPIFQVTG